MLISDDMQLLEEYAARGSEAAFSNLVSRYINLVYSVALRQTANHQEAEEITQAVFVVLARKAKSLRRGTILSGWLYQTARLTAANSVRRQIRRQNREQQAYMQSTLNEPEPDAWEKVGPLLEQAMAGLSEADRNAIVLRYFENKPLKEVGAALGSSDDAAKMRVSRALEKLRAFFLKRGITLSAAALGAALSAHSVQAAPAGLSAAVVAAACQGSALTASTLTLAKGTLKLMAWTKINIAVGVAAVAVIALQWNKIQTQKNDFTALQAQYQQSAQENQKQLATIKDLQSRDETLTQGLHRLVAENAQPSNRKAPPAATVAAPSGTASKSKGLSSMMENIMNDPDIMKAMAAQQAQSVKTMYAPFAKELNLNPEQRDALYNLIVGSMTNNMAAGLKMLSGTNSPGTGIAMADAQKEQQNQIHLLLGDVGYAQFQDYQSTLADRQMLDQMKASFSDNPLTDDQQQRLLQIMIAERKNAPTPVADPNDATFSPANAIAQMDQYMQSQDQINQRVYQQAGSFLSADQLQSLATSQSNALSATRMGMTMAQKMLGDSKGGQ